jgi:hypothetical protein
MISEHQRAEFADQVRRRRGPKKRVSERVPTSVKLPVSLFNALDAQARAKRIPLHQHLLRTLASAASAELR